MLACRLKSEGDKYLSLELLDGKPTNVGRSVETRIKSSSVSRNQVEIIPNCQSKLAVVKQIGPNDSAVNDVVIGHGLYVVAKEGDIINLLAGNKEFDYRILYEENPVVNDKKEDKPGLKKTNQDKAENPKPVKIPKMFLSKSARLAEFKKEELLAKGEWETVEGGKALVYVSEDSAKLPKSTILAFDMDGTIICTRSGKVFPKDDYDWKFLYDAIIPKLQRSSEHGSSKLVIITNQAGLKNGKTDEAGFKKKIESIVRQIGKPVLVFVLPERNEYRKPLPTIWTCLTQKYNGGVEPDLNTSVYCGDAAGRKKDHSKVDRLFALNVGVKFVTPEEFFLGQKPQSFTMPAFDPKAFVEAQSSCNNDHITFSQEQEIIVMVGYPGSGKSEFVKNVLLPKSYAIINRDTLKTAIKCKTTADSALQSGKSVVIDNTNPTVKEREEYIKLAAKHGCPARCFIVKIDLVLAFHNNRFRELAADSHAKVPEVAFHTFKSKFQEPSVTEGFTEVQQVNFVPSFNNDKLKALYTLYLLEK